MIKNITIGADPEVFLCNTNGFVSAEGKFGGTKEKPKRLDRNGFAIQEDNVMAEFNIPPATSPLELYDNLTYMLDYIKVGANQFDCKLNKAASAEFDIDQLNTEQAMTFGCDPDYNAYTRSANDGIIIENERLRTCGGHVHIGYDNPSEDVSIALIKALDITLGLPSIIKDPDTRRRSMYGKAGAYRLQPFGVEYRTLSNFWIFEKHHINWVFDGVHAAVDLVNSEALFTIEESVFGSAVKNVINRNDKQLAINLLKNITNLIKTRPICVD